MAPTLFMSRNLTSRYQRDPMYLDIEIIRMERSMRDRLLTMLAPASWGTTYVVTATLLPPDRPLLAALLRALPAGLLVLLVVRRMPPAPIWWWRFLALGIVNFTAFFPLLFYAAYRL